MQDGLSHIHSGEFPKITRRQRTGRSFSETGVLLLPEADLNKVWVLRRILNPLSTSEGIELLIRKLSNTKDNAEFLKSMTQQGDL